MKVFAKKRIFILLTLCCAVAATLPPQELRISVDKSRLCGQTFVGRLSISLPDGWKLSDRPHISPIVLKNLKDFRGPENYEKIGGSGCRMDFSVAIENPDVADNLLQLNVECHICRNICAIVTKNISIIFDHAPEKSPVSDSLWFFLLLGLLGGFILNLMPCVLPVLLMKLKSFGLRKALLGSVAGNYSCFAIFTGFLALMKIGGEEIGWGMYFQNPVILEIMTIYLFLLTLYSFGLITTATPSFRMSGDRGVFWGNFLSSVMASLVAIPCTAPALGTAAAFALRGSIPQLCAVFFAIATGFSMPQLVALFVPLKIPQKLGRFGVFFKRIVDCGVLITFLWIFWLLSHSLDRSTFWTHLTTFSLLTLLLIKKHARAALLLGMVVFPWCLSRLDSASIPESRRGDLTRRISLMVAAKRVVIFNITAAWCPTCLYNKSKILGDARVQQAIRNHGVEYLEGDMTHRNDELMEIIRRRRRVGIPFTVVYGPGAQEGILLGEIFSPEDAVEAINTAAKGI